MAGLTGRPVNGAGTTLGRGVGVGVGAADGLALGPADVATCGLVAGVARALGAGDGGSPVTPATRPDPGRRRSRSTGLAAGDGREHAEAESDDAGQSAESEHADARPHRSEDPTMLQPLGAQSGREARRGWAAGT